MKNTIRKKVRKDHRQAHMIFIIGGEGSGQAEYAAEYYPGAETIGNYHRIVREQLGRGCDPLILAESLVNSRKGEGAELVIWSCETGCGLVPVDAADRAFREISGRVNCFFARRADKVIRTVCGIGTVIKDAGEIHAGDEEKTVRDVSFAQGIKIAEKSSCKEKADREKTACTGKQNGLRKSAAEEPGARARSVMIAGTMSGAGKSLIAAGLCRIFREDGYSVAPFKAQNMALNSYITKDGAEIGRAQAVQAAACGIEPDARMNPVLLKPTTDRGSQIIVMGHPVADMDAREYYRRKHEFLPYVREAYGSLSAEHDIIVLEGAGSPAEINLKEQDIVNMPMAAMADAPVILVGNIDPGGVFAQLYGTVKLLETDEQERIAGLIINKFRGDISILEPGIKMLEERVGKPVLGVLPYMDVHLESEDSLGLQETEALMKDRSPGTLEAAARGVKEASDVLDIAVIRLPRISNFTDFDALSMESDVALRYVRDYGELGSPDAVILPGTKSTVRDLMWLRERGLDTGIRRSLERGAFVMGICGGYQMLGRKIIDEDGAETAGETCGLGYLPVTTVFEREKITRQVETVSDFGIPEIDGKKVTGYEVHMGRDIKEPVSENAAAGRDVAGTYIHGLFDEEDFRSAFLSYLWKRRGVSGETGKSRISYSEYREQQLAALAETMRKHLDIQAMYRMMGL